MSDDFVPVAEVGDIAPGAVATVTVDGREIAIFHHDGAFYALENSCPHQGAPLADGWIEGDTVVCPWHGWRFRLANGRMPLADLAGVDVFAVRLEGGTISVGRTPLPS